MYVCLCNGITDRDIRQTIADGASSVEEVMYITGAATRCGSCMSTIAAMVEQEAPRSARRSLRILTPTAA
jgi:bacterioferritin-associated ferredoxin